MLAETFKNQYVDHMIKTTYNIIFYDVCTTDKDNLTALSDCFKYTCNIGHALWKRNCAPYNLLRLWKILRYLVELNLAKLVL